MKTKKSLRKVLIGNAALLAMFCFPAQAQVFTETFGNAPGRVSNPYVPGNYGFSAAGTVVDGQYTVMPPQNITGSTGSAYWDDLADDHTGGGALMVLNAGSALDDFYVRDFSLLPGQSYRIAAWRYVVNGSGAGLNDPVSWSLDVRDTLTGDTMIGSGPIASTARYTWLESAYEFNVPSGCGASGVPVAGRMALRNGSAVVTGNDFYIDDISVTQISPDPSLPAFCPLPVLTLTKTASSASFTIGEAASYTLTVENTGGVSTPEEATVTDVVPAGLVIGALPGGCSAAGQTVTCVIAAGLDFNAPNNAASFTIPVTPNAMAIPSVTNTASVAGGGDPACPAAPGTPEPRCTDSITTEVLGLPELSLIKTATPTGFTVGVAARYTLTVQNTGTGETTDEATVTDVIPAGVTILSVSSGCAIAGQTVTCTIPTGLGNMPPNNTAEFTINVAPTATAPNPIVNTANVMGGGDPACATPTSCTGSATTAVAPAPPTIVPSNSLWSLLLLMLAMAGIGMIGFVQRR